MAALFVLLRPMPRINILDALDSALQSGQGIESEVADFFRLAESTDTETRERMLVALNQRLQAHPPERIGPVAILAGALLELGANPDRFPACVFDHLVDQLSKVPDDDDDFEMPAWYYQFEQAALSYLTRSADLRRSLPQRKSILNHLRRYQERYSFLGKMIRVLDDEALLVLHPSTERGFRFRMRGIADNFQLHLLLLGALAGSGPDRIPGKVPSQRAIALATDQDGDGDVRVDSDWQLTHWSGLCPGGEINRIDFEHTWIWNEGVPEDIELFEGTRVVLIGDNGMDRSWDARRVFSSLPGTLGECVPVDREEVRGWMARMLKELI